MLSDKRLAEMVRNYDAYAREPNTSAYSIRCYEETAAFLRELLERRHVEAQPPQRPGAQPEAAERKETA